MRKRKSVSEYEGGITGRDNFIKALALAYAIESIERCAPRFQALSDQEDMLKLLNTLPPQVAALLRHDAVRALDGANRGLRSGEGDCQEGAGCFDANNGGVREATPNERAIEAELQRYADEVNRRAG